MDQTQMIHRQDRACPFAIILGTNEIASAVAVRLHRDGYFVVLSHDPFPPVLRRKMAFHDALFDEEIRLEGIGAQRVDTGVEILTFRTRAETILITKLGLLDLIILRKPALLIDARMQKYQVTPDLRELADVTIGLGPSFIAGANCDYAVETHPTKPGQVFRSGMPDKPDGIAPKLGNRGAERFAVSALSGRWYTPLEIGTRVFKDYTVGFVGNTPVNAPFDGILRGLVRDGTEVLEGAKLMEIDPRGRKANWTGIESRARLIAMGVTKALTRHRQGTSPAEPRFFLTLIK
jgi:xanthine dehydrogenase accessory factor